MKPILYPENETAFTTNGLGRLWEATEATVMEELNGEYTLTVTVPSTARHFGDIAKGKLLLAKPNDVDDPQPFRIVGIHKTLGGGVTLTARHISYDTRKIVVTPFSYNTLAAALSGLPSKMMTTSGFSSFTLTSSATKSGLCYRQEPVTLRSLLSADEGSLLSVYGLEAKYDRFGVSLLARRGADHGVSMRYGKNLVGLETDENEDEVYATILPYYKDNEGGCVYGSLYTPTGYTAKGAVPVDVSSYITAGSSSPDNETWYPTVSQVNSAAAQWMADNKPYVTQRQISTTVSELQGINTVELGDTVLVHYAELGISEEYRIARLTYDALAERVTGVDLMLNTLATGKPMKWEGQMSGVAKAVKTETQKLEKKVDNATNLSHQLATGTYKGGSFMDDQNMYAPHIWGGATLNVGARDGQTPGGYNFNVDANGALKIGPMIKGEPDDEQASLMDDDPDLIYKLHYNPAANSNKGALSLYGVFQVHDKNGNVVGSMGRIKGDAGNGSETDGVAFAAGATPTTEVQDTTDSFFLCTSGGARLNFKGNKVYCSGNYVRMVHSSGQKVELSSSHVLLEFSANNKVEITANGITLTGGGTSISLAGGKAYYGTDEIETK